MQIESRTKTISSGWGFLFIVLIALTNIDRAQAQGWSSGSGNTTTTDNVCVGTAPPEQQFDLYKLDASAILQMRSYKTGYGNVRTQFHTIAGGSAGADLFKINFDSAGDVLAINGSGNVGIGTTSPNRQVELYNASSPVMRLSGNVTSDTDIGDIEFFNRAANVSAFIYGVRDGANSSIKLQFDTNNSGTAVNAMTIKANGSVGIGTVTPNSSYKLDVNGTISGTNVIAKFQDVAEWVPSSEELPAGTVVVLDSTKSNQVTSSSISYDTRVAGVVSAQPGIALGETSEGKVLVATTGRVRVMLDATKSAIHIGDLLVTSDIPGVAMKSEPVNLGGVQIHRPGTLIGKALEPLEKGKREILVLLSLQ